LSVVVFTRSDARKQALLVAFLVVAAADAVADEDLVAHRSSLPVLFSHHFFVTSFVYESSNRPFIARLGCWDRVAVVGQLFHADSNTIQQRSGGDADRCKKVPLFGLRLIKIFCDIAEEARLALVTRGMAKKVRAKRQ